MLHLQSQDRNTSPSAQASATRFCLTSKQRETIERLARNPHVKSLFSESSMSGESLTVRYLEQWVESIPHYGQRPRRHTHMAFSVKIRYLDNGHDNPEDVAKFEALFAQAQELFASVRQAVQS
jgi:hypothetical protein